MNDLRLLYQVDPMRKIVSLQFKQINSLESMLPLLQKFESLQSLSLHGNRLKSLPENLGSLQNIVQLDISNNLFQNIQQVVRSLKTIPNLTHLIYSFKNREQQDYVRAQLPKIQRINKKIVQNRNKHFASSISRRKQNMKLTQNDLQQVGLIYDEIRNIYKNSKYLVDKQLAEDFDKNVSAIMADLSQKMSLGGNQSSIDSAVVCCKYALLDICFVKLITYFYHFDKRIAVSLEKIHDYQAILFKQMNDILSHEIQTNVVEIKNISLKKQQLYKKEIKRLKEYQNQTHKQLNQSQAKNQQLLERLIKNGKQNILETTIGQGILKNLSPGFQNYNGGRSPMKRQKSPLKGKQITQQYVAMPTTANKSITLNQLKEIINQIYFSKQKHNIASKDSKNALETMEAHMYTYLNQKYGLKTLTIQWAMNIVNGIKNFGSEDAQVAIFGKILRNQLDQGFFPVMKRIKQQLNQQIRRFKGENYSLISLYQAQEIMLNIQIKRDNINIISARFRESNIVNNCITPQVLQKSIIDFHLRRHSQKISKIYEQFKKVDTDQDGIINKQALGDLCKNLNKGLSPQEVLLVVDPNLTDVITFSQFCENVQDCKELFDFFMTEKQK